MGYFFYDFDYNKQKILLFRGFAQK